MKEQFPCRHPLSTRCRLLLVVQMLVIAQLGSDSGLLHAEEFRRAGPVKERFFGMHVASVTAEPWPTVPIGSLRIWDHWPYVSWASLHRAPNTFAWESLDALVEKAGRRGVEIVYTFGYVPPWASSQPAGACETVTPGTCYPPDLSAWRDFVNAIVARYGDRIRYWELWNEPNAKNFWSGHPEDLAAMAEIAYPIIKAAGGTVLSPAPQGMNSDRWLQQYFRAGGHRYTDVVSFHGYLHGPPELIVTLTRKIAAITQEYGLGNKPLWDTEHSWGNSTWPFGDTQENQSVWLARFILLSAASGIDRSFWYMWDSAEWGTLFDRKRRVCLKPARAYREIHSWLVGTTPACSVSGGIYRCTLLGGSGGVVMWRDAGASQTRVDPHLRSARNLWGEEVPVINGEIELGQSPILLH